MDPITAALQLANTIAQIWLLTLQSMPPEQRAAQVEMSVKNMQMWQRLFAGIKLPGDGT